MANLKIQLVKSLNGRLEKHIATANSLDVYKRQAQGDAHGGHHAGNAGEDTGEQDDGYTVADTKFGDLLTHPHHEGRAGDEGHDDDQGGPEAGVGQDVVCLLYTSRCV